MFRHIRLLAIVLLLGTFLPGQSSAARPAYTFQKLARTGDISPAPHLLGDILESSIDDRGRIVYGADNGLLYYPGHAPVSIFGESGRPAPGGGKFSASWSSALSPTGELVFRGEVSGGTSGLFRYNSGKISSLIPDGTVASDGQALTPQYPVINAAGDFVFTNANSLPGIYLYSKGSITPVAVQGQSAPGGGTFNIVVGYAINQSDQIAFISDLSPSGVGLYVSSGGTITKILATGDVFPDGSTVGFPDGASINDSGQISFGVVNNQASPKYSGLFLYSGGTYSVVLPIFTTMPDGSYLEDAGNTSINNAGQIAAACQTSAGLGTYILSGGKLTTVAISGQRTPDGDFFSSTGEYGVRINNAGQVLLLSGTFYHYDALYLFSGGQLTRIAGEGDVVDAFPRFEYLIPINISAGDDVLFSDSTFPGGPGETLASPGSSTVNLSPVANQTTSIATGTVTYTSDSAMNSAGEVAFITATSENYGSLVLDSGNGLSVAVGGPNTSVSPGEFLGISNSGDVAFSGYGSGGSGLYLYSNGQTNFLSLLPGYPFSLAVNDSDSVASFDLFTPSNQDGIYVYANGVVTPVAVNGAAAPGGNTFSYTFPSQQYYPAMNDSAVVFASLLGTTYQSSIFLYENNTLSRLIGIGDTAPDGSTFWSVDSPSINSSGEVAFWGVTTSEVGIFVYNNGVITKVVASGDTIGIHTVNYLDYPQMSDSGHVAFLAGLTDGDYGIFLARPRSSGNNKTDLVLSSSVHPRPDLATIERQRRVYRSAIEAQQRRARGLAGTNGWTRPSLMPN